MWKEVTDLAVIDASVIPNIESQWQGYSVPLDPNRLQRAKRSYASRRIDVQQAALLVTDQVKPRGGDLVLARVDKLGQHQRIELPSGRRATLYPGDEILVCFGARYASDQFEALVPDDLGACQLVAGGGIAAISVARHSRMKRPTAITPIGLVADHQGRPLNLADFALPRRELPGGTPPFTVAVIGTAMNAGKTTTAAGLVRGMSTCGMRVGVAKVTGTGSGGDRWAMVDAGSHRVLDFTDAGHATTHRLSPVEIETIFTTLTAELSGSGVDAIVLEIADGLLLEETAALVRSHLFRTRVDGVMLAAADSMGACAGVHWLQGQGIEIFGVSGLVTASPLATREAQAALPVAVVDIESIRSGRWLPQDRADGVRRTG